MTRDQRFAHHAGERAALTLRQGPDYRVENHGSIYIVQPMNDGARLHLERTTDGIWFAGGLAVEPRYAFDLAAGLVAEGYTLEGRM